MAEPNGERDRILESIIDGRKMEAYAEHRTRDMHTCTLCATICYKKRLIRQIGSKWLCIDCLRKLKEALDTLEQWEESAGVRGNLRVQLDEGYGS